jgi:hypothetical protein
VGFFYRLVDDPISESDFKSVRELADEGKKSRYWADDAECSAVACSVFAEQIDAESTRKAIGSLRAKNVARGDIAGPGRLKASPSASSKSHHDWWRTGEDQAWRTFEVVS